MDTKNGIKKRSNLPSHGHTVEVRYGTFRYHTTQTCSQKPPWQLADHDGLVIEVLPTGRKIWRFRYRFDNKSQKITGWRERAELRLESSDFAALSKLTGELLTDLKMGGMDFAIATPTRKASEDALLKDAVTAFKARAQLATDALGGKGYKIVNLNLNSNGYPQPYMRAPMMMKAASMEAAPVTPEVEAGTSQVSMTADGSIEVLMP